MSAGRAVVTGAGGQDGSYLVELLRRRDYDVVGLERGDVDLTDVNAVAALLRDAAPDEVYNLASPSFVPRSWDQPLETADIGVRGVTALLEAVRAVGSSIRLVHASSAEVFGVPAETPQRETTPFCPRSPYGAAKAYGTFLVAAYRERYGLHAGSAILFNHESPLRSQDFVPAKIAHAAAAIAAGRQSELVLGDLDAKRDWGYAPDYVHAMWLMLQQEKPDDFVIATGELHTVRELVEVAFAHVDLNWRDHVRVDESLRRGQLYELVGDASKARANLGWQPSVTFEELVGLLVDAAA
ncbi:MAG TPA: GDP-mannose 4,6-dehydratase [Gaiellaceae bacterium]|nr:GDP-mannose 4,6-dehydratase [Gaiellaceae bacterium]